MARFGSGQLAELNWIYESSDLIIYDRRVFYRTPPQAAGITFGRVYLAGGGSGRAGVDAAHVQGFADRGGQGGLEARGEACGTRLGGLLKLKVSRITTGRKSCQRIA